MGSTSSPPLAMGSAPSNFSTADPMAKGGDDVEEKKEEEASSTSLSMGSTVEKLDGAPRGCVAGNVTPELLVVPTHKKKVIVVMGGKVEKEWAVKYSPTCCALSADDKLLAVGSGRDGENSVYFYSMDSGEEVFVLKNAQYIRNELSCLAITADGAFWPQRIETVRFGFGI